MAISAFSPARRGAGAVLSMGLAALLATACSASGQSAGVTAEHAPGTEDRSAAQEQAAQEDQTTEEGQASGEGGGSPVGSDVEIGDRQLVHTADLTVRVEDVSEAVEQAKELAIGADGYIASETVSTPEGGTPEGSLTLRIPSEGYEGALEGLAELGDRSDLERSVQDVTEEVADVESRVESSEAALETLRGYLEEAEDVDDLLRVESEIHKRQSELEAFQARLETLRNQTAYSTVHLTLRPPETYLEEPADESIGFLGGLERGWRALVAFGQSIAVVAGWLLPFLVVAAVLGAGPLWWYRSRRRGRSVGTAGEGAPKDGAAEDAGSGTPERPSGETEGGPTKED
ncbi:hypothetical protein A6A08_08000 [Nocardiopsis sp. TSRI0078]|uniref:DUF4349 domain-containing protein n=1 Tax=unclassified Nocardiopsis TaxID=2649073 RepID=UPI00095DD362|nr:DUF4349 domain-containing protein [Nocardiopsis sp. TSRI0078]OKI17182.1 hypothetical protein A6A08_08000 [Nocardiopsis sp. TSRI0078]